MWRVLREPKNLGTQRLGYRECLKVLRIVIWNIEIWPVLFIRNTDLEQNRISKACLSDWSGTEK